MENGAEGAASGAFSLLDERVQRWIWRREWTEFREVQERAIPLILAGDTDVILASATASGKTEAAFLPVITKMVSSTDEMGLTVYISPLNALINDQFLRLTELCETLEIPVYPWHGGINANVKKRFFENSRGILLITPESLEALFCNHGFEIARLFEKTRYVVVDELHSFIGSERGKQVQTLLHLLDVRVKRTVTRIGLSATLGDMELAAQYLSGFGKTKRNCEIIAAKEKNKKTKLLLKGITEDESSYGAAYRITDYLFERLRGKNNLIFPNTRSKVEYYTHLLAERCEKEGAYNEFYAHHGNLSKEIREEAENALKAREKSATVICTNTLELGIDIGEVECVVQIESPPSVASLRQRLGRSGRREGEAAVLRAFSIEEPLNDKCHIFSRLRESTFQLCACIELLLEDWCEAPRAHGLHLSTLVQQLLALICECGGILPGIAYTQLCETGPFSNISRANFNRLVSTLIFREIIEQDRNKLLLLAGKGERMANHFSFYAAFSSEIEYRIVSGDKTLGTLPVNSSIQKNDFILFAGKSWKIKNIDDKSRTIEVIFYGKGRPPVFTGGGFCIHPVIRKRMRELYESDRQLAFADETAKQFIEEGRKLYKEYGLSQKENQIIEQERDTVLLTWLGDRENKTLQLLFKSGNVNSYTGALGLTIPGRKKNDVEELLERLGSKPLPPVSKLLRHAQNLRVEKWDWTLEKKLLKENYVSLYLALDETKKWLEEAI
jgi:ATP-dependent Lhr-like helicase